MSTDISVTNHGSIVILTGVSDAGREWLSEHLPGDAQRWGKDGYVAETRYACDIIVGAEFDGMVVS